MCKCAFIFTFSSSTRAFAPPNRSLFHASSETLRSVTGIDGKSSAVAAFELASLAGSADAALEFSFLQRWGDSVPSPSLRAAGRHKLINCIKTLFLMAPEQEQERWVCGEIEGRL